MENVIYGLINVYGESLGPRVFQILEEIRESGYHKEYRMQELSPAGRIKRSGSQTMTNGKLIVTSDALQINRINFRETILKYSRLYHKLKIS